MRCFSVIALLVACISAASCMGMGYGSMGGYQGYEAAGAASQFGAVAQSSEYAASQSTSHESYESQAASFNSGASEYSAAAAGAAGGYASQAYGAYGAGGYGAAGAAYGSQAYGAAGAYGSQVAGAAYNQAGQFQSTKYSKTAQSSSVSASSSSAAVAASSSAYSASLSYYPNLAKIPFFSTCFNAMSADEMSYASLWGSNFNVQSTLNNMFSSNALFKSYFCAATGIQFDSYSASDLTRVYSAFGSNKAAFVGLVRNFARRGYVYNTSFASTLLQTASVEYFSAASKFAAFSSVQSWSQLGLTRFFANSYYQKQIASFCGISTWDEAIVTRTLSNYFRTNAVGTSLFFRHLLLNRVSSSCSYQQYASLSSQSYLSARSQYFNYYGGFQQYISQSSSSSSFARSSSYSAASSSAMSQSSSYSAMSASSTKTFSSVSQYYGSTFASSSLFKSCFALESFDTSSESRFYSSAFSSNYDFASAYGSLLQDTTFRRYLLGCSGYYDTFNSQLSSQFFSYAQQYPGFFARTTKLYARNGAFFSSSLGKLFLMNDSQFFFSSAVSQYRSSLLSVQSWNSCGLSALLQSRYYQRKLCSFFGYSTFDYNQVSGALVNLFQRNYAGGLLALRHLVYRKYIGQSFSVSSYASLNSYSYASSLAYRCPFYSSWSSYYRQYSQKSQFARSASYNRQVSQSQSQSVQQSASYQQAGAASSAAGYAGAASSYGGYSGAW
uniref:Mucin-like protein n=1 Tax=Laodelphax striatellus TaxID=195883 RepID=A0A1S5VJY7_LAOST|nr:mucin-like protein [Laodelphax striatellus]